MQSYAIEEKVFDRWRDLFTNLSFLLMEITSLSFFGEGDETPGKRVHFKDFRPNQADGL